MTRLMPNEIPCLIPGVKPVMMIQACDTEVVVETRTIPAETKYAITGDKTFLADKDYYIEDPATTKIDYKKLVAGTDYNVGDPILPQTSIFEKYETPEQAMTTQTIFDRYTDGYWCDNVDGVVQYREHPVEIMRTTTSTINGNQIIKREHAWGLWANRKTLDYVSICRRVNEDSRGESAHMFR